MSDSLWGDDFVVQPTKKVAKKIINKITSPVTPKVVAEKAVNSKSLPLDERLKLITENVYKILGRYANDTQVIKTREEFHSYIQAAISNGIISIDTETNNSLDPITCKIMGLCLYTPNMKNAYIPINHINPVTQERLDWQMTEEDVYEELNYLGDTFVVTHNGKFDYKVIKCTCGFKIRLDWDTLVGAKCLDENERSAGLKQQYIEKIDSSVEKYSIDHLFEKVEYAVVDPQVFALYAATDSYMTYKLYEWQKKQFELADNKRVYNMFLKVEMPLVEVIAEMELQGMEVDQEYGKLLSAKYHKQLDNIDNKLNEELDKLKPSIEAWRLTEDANYAAKGKTKSEQLTEPINLGSPTQLAILIYDIMKAPVIDKEKPRSTGEDVIKAIGDKMHTPFFELLLKRRELVKLLSTYIDAIPELAKRWPDGRVRTHFNQYGAATGRLSSSDPINFQNIPSHNKEIRMLFKATTKYGQVDEYEDKVFKVSEICDVETDKGWTRVSELLPGMTVKCGEENLVITSISNQDDYYIIHVGE